MLLNKLNNFDHFSDRVIFIRVNENEELQQLQKSLVRHAKVNLQLGKDTSALLVPTQAVVPTARNKQVYLLRKDSVQFTVVETGIRDSAFVQVLKGLQAGDTVITTGLMAVRPNAKVKIARVNSLQ